MNKFHISFYLLFNKTFKVNSVKLEWSGDKVYLCADVSGYAMADITLMSEDQNKKDFHKIRDVELSLSKATVVGNYIKYNSVLTDDSIEFADSLYGDMNKDEYKQIPMGFWETVDDEEEIDLDKLADYLSRGLISGYAYYDGELDGNFSFRQEVQDTLWECEIVKDKIIDYINEYMNDQIYIYEYCMAGEERELIPVEEDKEQQEKNLIKRIKKEIDKSLEGVDRTQVSDKAVWIMMNSGIYLTEMGLKKFKKVPVRRNHTVYRPTEDIDYKWIADALLDSQGFERRPDSHYKKFL